MKWFLLFLNWLTRIDKSVSLRSLSAFNVCIKLINVERRCKNVVYDKELFLIEDYFLEILQTSLVIFDHSNDDLSLSKFWRRANFSSHIGLNLSSCSEIRRQWLTKIDWDDWLNATIKN